MHMIYNRKISSCFVVKQFCFVSYPSTLPWYWLCIASCEQINSTTLNCKRLLDQVLLIPGVVNGSFSPLIISLYANCRLPDHFGFFFCLFFWRVHNFQFDSFFSFIFLSWRLITLQYCSGFCHTLTWISHGFTCVPHPDPPLSPPSPSNPSGSSQCTSPEHLSHASNLPDHFETDPEEYLVLSDRKQGHLCLWKINQI